MEKLAVQVIFCYNYKNGDTQVRLRMLLVCH